MIACSFSLGNELSFSLSNKLSFWWWSLLLLGNDLSFFKADNLSSRTLMQTNDAQLKLSLSHNCLNLTLMHLLMKEFYTYPIASGNSSLRKPSSILFHLVLTIQIKRECNNHVRASPTLKSWYFHFLSCFKFMGFNFLFFSNILWSNFLFFCLFLHYSFFFVWGRGVKKRNYFSNHYSLNLFFYVWIFY